jgi:hypothetical protein
MRRTPIRPTPLCEVGRLGRWRRSPCSQLQTSSLICQRKCHACPILVPTHLSTGWRRRKR